MEHRKSLAYRACSAILYPLIKEGRSFFFLWYCATVIPVLFHCQEGLTKSIYHLFLGGFVCYPIVIFLCLMKGKWERTLRSLFICTGLLNVIVDVTVIETTKHPFYYEHVALILGSNLSEGTEFFQSYFNESVLLSITVHLLLCFVVYFFLKYLYRGKVAQISSLIATIFLLALMICTNIMKSESWSEIYLCKLGLFLKYKSPPDLHEYAGGHSIISKEGCIIPDKIVVIFGESLSRDHMSLYDYTKNTNPLLQSIYDEGSLFLFKNVESATTGTVSSFEQMLSSYRGEDSIEWYRCVTIFDVAKAAGYKTVWMSNQSRVGTYDNIVAKYADLADSTIWIGNAMGVYHKGFDGALVEEVDKIRPFLPEHSLLFVHLMGSHEKFSDRFPPSFAEFSEMDYSEMPKNQRQNLADYDNSVLYNDYVVSSLFELFSEDDAVCMYFPDHGLDIYESSPTFVGHATVDSISISAAKKIPFMVYTSDKVKSAQSLFDDIRYASDECQGYVTSNIIYTISDLMGVTMVDESEIQTKSIFHTSQ